MSSKLLALSWLTIDQTIISGFPPDRASERWGLVAPRQTAKAPEDHVSKGALQFMLTEVLMEFVTI